MRDVIQKWVSSALIVSGLVVAACAGPTPTPEKKTTAEKAPSPDPRLKDCSEPVLVLRKTIPYFHQTCVVSASGASIEVETPTLVLKADPKK